MFATKSCIFLLVLAVANPSVRGDTIYLTEAAKGPRGSFALLEELSHYGTSGVNCKVELDNQEINCPQDHVLIAVKILLEDMTEGAQIRILPNLDRVEIYRQPDLSGSCPFTGIIRVYVACRHNLP